MSHWQEPQRGQNDYQAPAPYPAHGSSASLASYNSYEQPYPSNEHGHPSQGYPSNDQAYPSNDQGYPPHEQAYSSNAHGYPSNQYGGYPSHDHVYADNASAYADSTYNLNPSGPGKGQYHEGSAYHDEPPLPPPVRRNDKRATYLAAATPKSRGRRKRIIISLVAAVIILGAAGAALYFFVFKKKDAATSTSTSSPHNNVAVAVTGGDGSTIVANDGTNFTYTNPFGGQWYWDANDPFNNGARPQSWSPALNETFTIGEDKIRGVNIGGWLVTEPFIVPSLYQTVQASAAAAAGNITVIDEWTLLQAGGQQALEDHYNTFITEQDFMQIAAAGLNFVRIPIAYWAIEVLEGEGFLGNVSWTYFLKAIQWARKYGLRINIDLHCLPGSQNGWNHSGRLGTYNVLFGPMGIANAQRSLDYIRIIAEFISQPEYVDVIPMFGVTNEPQGGSITQDILSRYYLQAYNNVRLAGGIGAGNGPIVSFHDGFLGPAEWAGFLPNADRATLDMHPYLCFTSQTNAPIDSQTATPCTSWGGLFNTTMADFGFIVAGEWSNAITDCGLYVNGVGQGTRYEGTFPGSPGQWPVMGNCTTDVLDYQSWNATTKAAYMTFAQSSMDALQNWFFWTWKIGNSTAGIVEAPQWSYSLGLQEGWMPPDPRAAVGQCGNPSPFPGPLSAWQTGGAGAGSIPTSVIESLAWPPPSIFWPNSVSTPGSLLPTYTPAGTPVTLPGPTFTTTSATSTGTANAGDGWANASDQAGMMGPAAGCTYYDPWVGSSFAPPSPLCTGAAALRRRESAAEAPEPAITAPPTARR
ncbi:glycoside hydrolase superfamily [Mycena galopus ATCC 62051]|nr:glycoside hydrolase superfamily [Mycena galopus ATCC 62051]